MAQCLYTLSTSALCHFPKQVCFATYCPPPIVQIDCLVRLSVAPGSLLQTFERKRNGTTIQPSYPPFFSFGLRHVALHRHLVTDPDGCKKQEPSRKKLRAAWPPRFFFYFLNFLLLLRSRTPPPHPAPWNTFSSRRPSFSTCHPRNRRTSSSSPPPPFPLHPSSPSSSSSFCS